jgi:signal transduction histidine kinase
MAVASRGRSIAFFVTLGICLVALAVALNVGWILINWRAGVLLILGVLFFSAIIAGLVLNTIFLVREIRRNEQHDHFINAVTHELKTPVASIRLYLETLQSRQLDEAKRKEFYGIMLSDSERLLHTIEQVLRAARTGPARSHRELIDLKDIADECIMLARRRHHLNEQSLRPPVVPNSGSRVLTMADPDELKAALSNLLDNAIKYSGKQVRVDVKVASEDNRVRVSVRDYGVGMPKHELKRVFKRFYRIPGSVAARVKGTGLGLFIVRSVVEKHGGRAFAESDGPGHGSTFTIELPAASQNG